MAKYSGGQAAVELGERVWLPIEPMLREPRFTTSGWAPPAGCELAASSSSPPQPITAAAASPAPPNAAPLNKRLRLNARSWSVLQKPFPSVIRVFLLIAL